MGQNSDVTAVIFNRDELIGCNHRGAGIQVSGKQVAEVPTGLALAVACITSGERIWDKLRKLSVFLSSYSSVLLQ